MKKIILPLALVASIVGVTTVSSCKKNNDKTAKDYIVGSWKLNQTADDLNGNGKLDASEEVADSSNGVYTFSSGGSGTVSATYSGIPVSVPILWSLSSDNNYVKIIIPSETDTLSAYIDNISATNMTLKDTTGGAASWALFTKE